MAEVILRVDLTLLIRFLRSLRLGIYRSLVACQRHLSEGFCVTVEESFKLFLGILGDFPLITDGRQ